MFVLCDILENSQSILSESRCISPAVSRVMTEVLTDVSADISLAGVAASCGMTPSYFSDLFHRETGKTLTEHIRERRIDHAKHLLKTTELQIQTVALHCGILDVQYFSRIFKRQTGKTPREYRESRRKGSTQA